MRRCVALLLAIAMTAPLGEGLISRALVATAKAAPAPRVKQSVVVFDFVSRNQATEGVAHTFTRDLRLAMEQSPAFELVTFTTQQPYSASIDRAIREQRLKDTDLIGPFDPDKPEDKERAVKIASTVGADLALMGVLGDGDYQYTAADKHLKLEVMAQLLRARGTKDELGQLVQAVTGKGDVQGDAMQGVLEDRARSMAAKEVHNRLAGINAPQVNPEKKKGPKAGRWVYYVVGAVALGLMASLLGKKSGGGGGPAAPAALRTAATRDGVMVSWMASTDASVTGYQIYRSVVARSRQGGESVLVKEVPAGTTSYTDAPLDASVGYLYTVVPISADGKKGAAVSSTTPVVPGMPAVVTGLRVTVDQRTVQLNWTKNTEDFVMGYRIYRSSQMNAGFAAVADVGSSAVAYVDQTGLAGGLTYFYKVVALGPTGQESDKETVAAVAASTDLRPSAPKNVVATSSLGQRVITVTWDRSLEPDVQYYQVYRGLTRNRAGGNKLPGLFQKAPGKLATRGGPYQVVGDHVTGTTFSDSTVEYNTTYYYAVKAVASQGDSALSTEVSASPDRVPVAPQNITAQAGDGMVTVHWAPVSEPDVVGYNVYREMLDPTSTAPATKVKLTVSPWSDVTYIDRAVINDTQYRYFITAVDTAGNESLSSLPAGPVTPAAAPGAPTNVQATAGNSKVTLVWNRVADANLKEYRVFRSDAPQLAPQYIATVPKGTTTTVTFADTTVQNMVTYYYQVAAVNNSDVVSVHSTPVAKATPGDPPAAPTGVTATATDRSVQVRWSPVATYASGAALIPDLLKSYRVYRTDVLTGARTLVKELSLSTLTEPAYEDTTPPLNTQLRYSVTVLMNDANGGVLESAEGAPVDTSPVIVMRRVQAPVGLAGVVSVNGSQLIVTLNWQASTDPSALGYVIYASTAPGGPFTPVFTPVGATGVPSIPASSTGKAVTSDDLPAMKTATSMYFKIAVVDKLQVIGFQSDPAIQVNLLSAPESLQVTNTDAMGNPLDLAISLSWLKPLQVGTQPQNILGYRVYRSGDPTGGWTLITATPVAPGLSMTYTDMFNDPSITLPAAIGKDFYYQVVAVIGLSDGSTVESRPVVTPAATTVLDVPPPKVQGVSATLGSGVVTVRWLAVTNADGSALRDLTRYTVYRQEKGDLTGATLVQFNVTGALSYRDTDILTSGKTYQYRVRAYDYSNAGDLSDIKEVVIP